MTASSDTIIVGGGVIGMALAWRLRARGGAVTVIDAGGPAATRAAAGMLAPSFEKTAGPLAGALYNAGVDSLHRWRGFARDLNIEANVETSAQKTAQAPSTTDEGPCNAIDYRAEGIIGAAFSGEACDRLKRDHDALEKQGAAVRWLDADAARRHEPALADTVQGALLAPDDGQVDPPATLAALQAAFEKRGGRLLRAAKVVRLLTSKGRIEGVRLADRSELFARTVVLAAGVSAAALVPRLSRASARDRGPEGAPALFPVKGDALALAGDGLALQRTIRTEGAYICPKSDGRIVIGASETPHDATLVPDDETIAALREAATGVVPGLAGLREWARWAGLRPATSDRAPIVGPDPEISGLFYALGHFRNGVLLAPLTADILADRIADGALSHWFIPFSIERFDP